MDLILKLDPPPSFKSADFWHTPYSIYIVETQLYKLNSQSNKKNSDLLHITISDALTESQVPNEFALKKFDTKVEVIPPISQPNSPTYNHNIFITKH